MYLHLLKVYKAESTSNRSDQDVNDMAKVMNGGCLQEAFPYNEELKSCKLCVEKLAIGEFPELKSLLTKKSKLLKKIGMKIS